MTVTLNKVCAYLSTILFISTLVVVEVSYAAFEDVAASSGINHASAVNPRTDTGGGVAWIDIDNDGFDDIYVPNPVTGASWLYHNVSDGNGGRAFTEIASIPNSDAHNSAYPSTGVAVGDYDGDGCDDLFVTNGSNSGSAPFIGAHRNTLLKNNYCTDGTLTFTDVTQQSGIDSDIFNSVVSSFGDIDNDGDLDLYVGNYLPLGNMESGQFGDFCDPNQLYINNNGVFTEISAQVGVDDRGCALGSALTDFDDDGDLDIYVVNDFNNPGRPLSNFPDIMYRNMGVSNGNPVFEVIDTSGITTTLTSMGIAIGDYDSDGDLDYYTTAFSGAASLFNAVSFELSVTGIFNSNNGDGTFTDQTVLTNTGSLGTLITSDLSSDPAYADSFWLWFSSLNTGWGTAFFDAENDGDLDLYVANGAVSSPQEFSSYQPNRFFLNHGTGVFEDVGIVPGPPQTFYHVLETGETAVFDTFIGHDLAGTRDTQDCQHASDVLAATGRTIPCYDFSRGIATSDYDNDGDVDVFVVNTGLLVPEAGSSTWVPGGASEPRLYRNDSSQSSNANWLGIRLTGLGANHRGIGSKIRVTTASGTQLREIHAGSSHGSTHSAKQHFGLGSETTVSNITVEWPSGTVQQLTNISANQIVTITEPGPLPVITGMNAPNGFVVGEGVVIEGNYLCGVPCDHATTKVNINGIEVSPFGIADTWLIFFIPEGAQSGQLTVTTADGVSEPQDFTLDMPPVITSMSAPNGFVVGQGVLIEGNNLCGVPCDPATTKVNINGLEVSPFGFADTWLLFIIPEGAESGQLTVTTANGVSEPQDFTLDTPPVITSMSAPNGFVVGQGVVIEGNYLCGVPCDHATTKVNINGIEVSPFGIADTWLIFFIPEGAESGQLTVTTADGVSQPQTFTLE